jgi:hypothetical protein
VDADGGRPAARTDATRDDGGPPPRDARHPGAGGTERSGLDIVAILLALVGFALMFDLLQAMERI